MPSQATSTPLTVSLLAALWVSLSRCGVAGSPGPACDNGKLSLDMDLSMDAVSWDCEVSAWPESTQKHQSIDTVYDPEPARQICMDESISYNLNIPNSGPYRPVSAESGEYLYCPPQRWLNNLHHGATVLLYHPCAPQHERHLLSNLAHSCLSDYIISPHPQLNKHLPVAVVSWGRTLKLSTAATSDICDWLETTQTIKNRSDSASARRKYNLLLTWPARLHRQEQSSTLKDSLSQCCEQTISSLLSVTDTELEPRMKMEHLKQTKAGAKSRLIRAAIRGKQVNFEGPDTISKNDSSLLASPNNRTIPQRTNSVGTHGPSAASPLIPQKAPQSKIPNKSFTPIPTHRADSLGFETSPSQKSMLMQPSPKPSDLKNPHNSAGIDVVNGVQNHTARPEALIPKDYSIKQRDKDGVKVNELNEKHVDKDLKAEGKITHNEVVDLKEREVEHKQIHSAVHAHHKNSSSDSVSKSQSHPQQNPQTAGSSQPNSRDCEGCKAGEHCDCTKASGPEARSLVVNNGLLRTSRTDEAVWAAAALGFLLVLLTLSVLHTRLYRHWRTSPSLYWHDPRQDYDSVADVIRRRLQIAKRRRKRSRRQECALLPSSSSSDDYP